ncbi:MAG: ATP-binding protein [Sutterella sp.]|nr:ATP-binding protein [Sutterella sp.]
MSVDLNLMKEVILENQETVPRKELIERGEKFEPRANYVLIGLRRAGKSYTLFEHIQRLIKTGEAKPQDILYVNFEDDRMYGFEVTDFDRLLHAYHELFGSDRRPRIFLDEMQNIAGWEKFARRLADSDYRVFLTGSNARMLSAEIHTTLGARYIAREIRPFSFEEFLRFRGIAVSPATVYGPRSSDVKRLCREYLEWGGLAPVFSLTEKREWLQSMRENVLLRDIASRNAIRSTAELEFLLRKLAESVMQPVTGKRLMHIMESAHMTIARNTLTKWLGAMGDAFLIESISNYRDNLSQRMMSRKHYFADTGILRCMLSDPLSKLLENLVALELIRRFGREAVFFYRNGVEVDFFVPEVGLAVQASVSLSSSATFDRETQALVAFSSAAKVNERLIVTLDDEQDLNVQGSPIRVVPLWKWLLGA